MKSNEENLQLCAGLKCLITDSQEKVKNVSDFLESIKYYKSKYLDPSHSYNRKTIEFYLKKNWFDEMLELLLIAPEKPIIAKAIRLSIEKNIKYICDLDYYSICNVMSNLIKIKDSRSFIEAFLNEIYYMSLFILDFKIKKDYLRIINSIFSDFCINLYTALCQYKTVSEIFNEMYSNVKKGLIIDEKLINKINEQDYYTDCNSDFIRNLVFTLIGDYNSKINIDSTSYHTESNTEKIPKYNSSDNTSNHATSHDTESTNSQFTKRLKK